MRGDQLARQGCIVRAIEASPNGLTVTKIAQREETGFRTIYRGLEALQEPGFPLYTERVDRSNRWAFIDTFKFKILPPFTQKKFMSFVSGPRSLAKREMLTMAKFERFEDVEAWQKGRALPRAILKKHLPPCSIMLWSEAQVSKLEKLRA